MELEAFEVLEGAVRALRSVLQSDALRSLSESEVEKAATLFADVERIGASGVTLMATKVMESGSHAKSGHGSAADWLGSLLGSSTASAKGRLTAGRRAAQVPELSEALRQGELSTGQLKVLADIDVAAPGAAEKLLPLVTEHASYQELNTAAARLRAAARSREDERARRHRVHQMRHFRWSQDPEGGIRGTFSCDEVAWARVSPGLEAAAKARCLADPETSFEAHRVDAFLEWMASTDGSGRACRTETLVLVDAAALQCGVTTGDEVCEIDGIGPISVAAATELIGEGSLRFLIREGTDIRTVTKSSRTLARKVALALCARDRSCSVPNCGKCRGLEADHCRVDYAAGGPTCLDNLALLCPEHHALKTYGGWRLEGGPGQWKWLAPARPPSAGRIARERRVAAAKGKISRNSPRRS